MSNQDQASNIWPGGSRIAAIDVTRTLALLAMAIYHFAWDLEYFGYAPPGTIVSTGWIIFARLTAGSFMVLVGIGIILSHANGFKKRSFLIRLAKVSVAAAVISVATWFIMPEGFIFFGILHSIAVSSVLSLLFIRLPWLVNLIVAIFFLTGPFYLKSLMFTGPMWYWLGLSLYVPATNDFEPLFPWFGLVLLGMVAARLSIDHGIREKLLRWRPQNVWIRISGFFSRHSLLTYLIHQPVLLGLLYIFVAITGGPDRTPAFVSACVANCSQTRDGPFCQKFCSCVTGELKSQQLWSGIQSRKIDITRDPRVKAITRSCSFPKK